MERWVAGFVQARYLFAATNSPHNTTQMMRPNTLPLPLCLCAPLLLPLPLCPSFLSSLTPPSVKCSASLTFSDLLRLFHRWLGDGGVSPCNVETE